MRYVALFLFVIGLFGCGKEAKLDVDPVFYPYLMKFKMFADQYGKNVPIKELTVKFSDLGPRYCGMCTHSTTNNPKLIEIDHMCWDDEDDLTREELMFHEFGHCLMDKGHNDNLRPDGTPVSIMYSYIIGSSLYSKYYKEYINELFQ